MQHVLTQTCQACRNCWDEHQLDSCQRQAFVSRLRAALVVSELSCMCYNMAGCAHAAAVSATHLADKVEELTAVIKHDGAFHDVVQMLQASFIF